MHGFDAFGWAGYGFTLVRSYLPIIEGCPGGRSKKCCEPGSILLCMGLFSRFFFQALPCAADVTGYVRYWLSEHHNLASVASPAPDLMIGQIAAVTKHIHVGSGGVMLPNHAPLVVAERFKMLEALFPGRIDLGLGRAPGTDPATAHALRSRLDRRDGDDFLERLQELILWETRGFPPGHPYNNVVAMPDDSPLPPIWLLGSSDYSSELAAQVGMGFAFAHHFASHDAVDAMTNYHQHFKPSGWRATPHGILAVAVVAAETDSEAEKLASSMDLNRLRRDRGQYL